MGLFGWIFYIFMGVLCFLLLLFFEHKYHISRREKFVFSLLFLMIVAGFCYRYVINVTSDMFLIFVFTFISDILYTSYFLDIDFFDRNEKKISYYLFLIFVGFLLNQELINKVSQVFLTGEELRLLFWTVVFIFLYRFMDDKKIISKNETPRNLMSRDSILEQYAKLKYQYYDECNSKDKDFSNLLYAIMIYQNHKRSKILRKFDYFMYRFHGGTKTLGIMQVESKKYITDVESIEITRKKLEKMRYKDSKKVISSDISTIIKNYSEENFDDIQYIFDIIKKF